MELTDPKGLILFVRVSVKEEREGSMQAGVSCTNLLRNVREDCFRFQEEVEWPLIKTGHALTKGWNEAE